MVDCPPPQRHTTADWLSMHGVDAQDMQRFLDQGVAQLASCHYATVDVDIAHTLKPQAAWMLCAHALETMADPAMRFAIAQAHDKTRLVLGHLPKGGPRAVTLPDGGNGHPMVTCPFDGLAKDLITLMHEFGHAVQIIMSEGRFMPPVLRETCAFAAEKALLEHLQMTGHPLFEPLQATWQHETAHILRGPTSRLCAALADPTLAYNYAWNYPPARILVQHSTQDQTGKLPWADLFAGHVTLKDMHDISRDSSHLDCVK